MPRKLEQPFWQKSRLKLGQLSEDLSQISPTQGKLKAHMGATAPSVLAHFGAPPDGVPWQKPGMPAIVSPLVSPLADTGVSSFSLCARVLLLALGCLELQGLHFSAFRCQISQLFVDPNFENYAKSQMAALRETSIRCAATWQHRGKLVTRSAAILSVFPVFPSRQPPGSQMAAKLGVSFS